MAGPQVSKSMPFFYSQKDIDSWHWVNKHQTRRQIQRFKIETVKRKRNVLYIALYRMKKTGKRFREDTTASTHEISISTENSNNQSENTKHDISIGPE